MKQGNPTKKLGIIGYICAIIAGSRPMPEKHDYASLSMHKNMLLTNGGSAPIPYAVPNQRQKRKLARQMNRKVN